MTNTPEALLRRLLYLYPVKQIRNHFDSQSTGKQDVVNEVVERYDRSRIVGFARECFSCTKQHVRLFEHDMERLDALPDSIPGLDGEYSIHQRGDVQSLFGLVRLPYHVVLSNPLEETDLIFLWPIRVDLAPTHVAVNLTTMEKSIRSYVEESRGIHAARKTIHDRKVIDAVQSIPSLRGIGVLDLNMGIKSLWRNGTIDSTKAEWRRSRSMAEERMDEEYLLKEVYPNLYEEIVQTPLLKSVFRFVTEREDGLEQFVVDPTGGTLVFSRYLSQPGITEDVIQEILRDNQ